MRVAILYQRLLLPADHPDYGSEVGVLDSVQAVRRSLEADAHEVWEVTPSTAAELVAMLDRPRPDVVVNLCEGFAGESKHEAHVAGVLELLGLPYTGCPPACLSLVHNKARCKRVLMAHQLATPAFVAFSREESPRRDVLAGALREGPMIVKPVTEDASLGIGPDSVVTNLGDALARIADIQARYGDAMAERYIEGREFNVGVVALPHPHALPLAEIDFQRDGSQPWAIVTYDSKWAVGSAADRATPVRCPVEVDKDVAEKIYYAALNAFRLTGCRDYGRVDVRVDERGRPWILEVNANPDIGPSAGFPQALEADNIEYDEFVQRMVAIAAARKSAVGGHKSQSAGEPSLNGNGKPPIPNPQSQIPNLRPFVPDDCEPLLEILRACRMFRADEIDVAAEILDETIRDGEKAGYRNVVAEQDGRVIGWSCYGLVPQTDASFDLYWIAVEPGHQNRGVGRQLLAECEDYINALGARWVLAETSSTALYDSTRAFYARCGFQIVGSVPDYYRAGDGLVVFGKRLENAGLRGH